MLNESCSLVKCVKAYCVAIKVAASSLSKLVPFDEMALANLTGMDLCPWTFIGTPAPVGPGFFRADPSVYANMVNFFWQFDISRPLQIHWLHSGLIFIGKETWKFFSLVSRTLSHMDQSAFSVLKWVFLFSFFLVYLLIFQWPYVVFSLDQMPLF